MDNVIASTELVRSLADFLIDRIPAAASEEVTLQLSGPGAVNEQSNSNAELTDYEKRHLGLMNTCSPWTSAVHKALVEFGKGGGRGWVTFPTEKPCKGEYLCDFMVFEPNYGCRIACESQWDHGSDQAWALDWAFEKLRGVKSDIKLFIYEGKPTALDVIAQKHLVNYAQLDPHEVFLALRWNKPSFEARWWTPATKGLQTEARFVSVK